MLTRSAGVATLSITGVILALGRFASPCLIAGQAASPSPVSLKTSRQCGEYEKEYGYRQPATEEHELVLVDPIRALSDSPYQKGSSIMRRFDSVLTGFGIVGHGVGSRA